ncbi:twin-arginine translocation signal domain-containing protein [Jiangella gansuensis]
MVFQSRRDFIKASGNAAAAAT